MKLSSLNTLIFSLILAGCASKNSAAPAPQASASAQSAARPATHGGFLQPAGKTTLAAQGRDPAEFPGYVEQLKQ